MKRLTHTQKRLLAECCELAAIRFSTCVRERYNRKRARESYAADAVNARELAAWIRNAGYVALSELTGTVNSTSPDGTEGLKG